MAIARSTPFATVAVVARFASGRGFDGASDGDVIDTHVLRSCGG